MTPYRLCLAALFVSCQAHAAPLVLSKPHTSTYISQARPGADGLLCIVGETMNPDGDLQSSGLVMLVSLAKNAVLWRQVVPAPEGNAASRFVACRVQGKEVYVAANVDTHTEQSLNQGLVWAYRFGTDGKLLAQAELANDARNAFAYDIGVADGGVTVAGHSAVDTAQTQANTIFFAKFDAALKSTSMAKLATGAFLTGAAARLDGGALYLGGNFGPAHGAADALADDYAVSKIVGGKYQFSVRPQKGKARDIATAITPAGELVSLGYAAKTTHLTVVGPDGKVKEDRQLASAWCETTSMSADASAVYAVRAACGKSQEPSKLVALNRKTGVETIVAGIGGEPRYVLALDDKLVVIAKKGDGVLLQTVAKGQ